MKIFILDEDIHYQWEIEKIIIKECHYLNISLEKIECFGKANQLLQSSNEKGNHILYLFGIHSEEADNATLNCAQKIRERDPYANIIILFNETINLQSLIGKQIFAMDYLNKSCCNCQFKVRLRKSLQMINTIQNISSESDFNYCQSKCRLQIPFHEILYIETSYKSHMVLLHTKNEKFEIRANLSDIGRKERRLYQCHRSFLVNPKNIMKIDKCRRVISFKNNKNCFVSRNKLKELLLIFESNDSKST